MPWEFVAVSGVVEVTATGHTLAEPSGAQPGDLLVAVISSRIASVISITLPAGWALVAEQKTNNTLTNTNATASGMMAYIVRGVSAPSYAFTHPAAPSVALGRVLCYRNNQAAPLDTGTSFTTATNTTAVSGAGLTTAADNELIVAGFCGGQEATVTGFDAATDPGTDSGSGSNVTANPAVGAWQERADSNTTTGADTSLCLYDAVKVTAGATGSLTCTASLGAAHVVVAGAFKLLTPWKAPVNVNQSVMRAATW